MSEVVADIRVRAEGALLATATGDALGWPQEDRSGRVGGRSAEPKLEFVDWRRRDGSRYAAHEEVIGPGEYSDDTQLILAVARALRAGDDWWERLTRVELPFWVFYERGGGAATKRAARAWAGGKAPWADNRRAGYFDAGGNGVAMRILPHALRGCARGDFAPVASAVVKDGLATHGHPIALVGALAYAYALWFALRREEVLEYGALITEVRSGVDSWSALPDDVPPDWRAAAEEASGGYEGRWRETVAAMLDLLSVAVGGIEQGALAVDRETLDQLGAFDRSVSGAGTVTAASAIFLASRYASRPAQGLVAGAFAHGADTDTLAAMAGGLLGAINGRDWLDVISKRVQDYEHLVGVARDSVKGDNGAIAPARPHDFRRLWRRMANTAAGSELPLPDGRHGVLERIVDVPTATRHEITVYVVRTDDGQTMFLKRVARSARSTGEPANRRGEPSTPPTTEPTPKQPPPAPKRRAVVAVEAADIEQSIAFYRDLIGLELTRRTPQYASFGGHVLILPSNGSMPRQRQLELEREILFEGRPKIMIFVAPSELEPLRDQLMKAAVPVTSVAAAEAGRRHFSCVDPDGTVVEVREANGGG